MASVLAQCQCAATAVPNLHSIAFFPSSSSSSTLLSPKQPFSKTSSGLSKNSGALGFRVSRGRLDLFSSAERSLICRIRAAAEESSWRGDDSLETFAGRPPAPRQQLQRRELVGRVISASLVLPALIINAGSAAFGASAAAEDEEEQSPESASTTDAPAKAGLVERLLERSKANKARYTQERLDAYYRRNFKDYFGFLKGGLMDKDKEKLTEAEKGILNWLEKNQ